MAHDIQRSRITGKAEMAYTGAKPWHGLGQELTQGAPLDVWTREAGLDWQALEGQMFFQGEGDEQLTPCETHKKIYRSDSRQQLGVVGQGYQLVQPSDVMGFFRDLTEREGWHIQTAGALRGGKKLWCMAGRGDMHDTVVKGDAISGRLLLATSLDGSMRTVAALVSERVVCANTLAVALGEGGRKLAVSHRSVFDPTAIKHKLGLMPEAWARFMDEIRGLAETRISKDDARDVLRSVFGAPSQSGLDLSWLAGPGVELEQQEGRNAERAFELFDGEGIAADARGSKGTAWGLLNAVTQMVDHEMGRSADTRIDSAWFGRGNDYKAATFKALQELTA
jgi:phage/plasmid-like protein (TIGR03299 family)